MSLASAHDDVPTDDIDALAELLRGRRSLLLSGAGISTESGIPDYRGPDRVGPPPTPITYQRFVKDARARQRYWARSVIGWPTMRAKEPNAGHRAVAQLEHAGFLVGVVTQNVDGLHQAAGSREVVELHGSLARVVCLSCGAREARDAFQARLEALNPGFAERAFEVLPDGDAALPDDVVDGFQVAVCRVCGGDVKADVVYFGENVPAARAQRAFAMLDAADALVVVGSSLTVRSGSRFVDAAVAVGKPVAIVNDGPTRGDGVAQLRLAGRLGTLLPEVVRRLEPNDA